MRARARTVKEVNMARDLVEVKAPRRALRNHVDDRGTNGAAICFHDAALKPSIELVSPPGTAQRVQRPSVHALRARGGGRPMATHLVEHGQRDAHEHADEGRQ